MPKDNPKINSLKGKALKNYQKEKQKVLSIKENVCKITREIESLEDKVKRLKSERSEIIEKGNPYIYREIRLVDTGDLYFLKEQSLDQEYNHRRTFKKTTYVETKCIYNKDSIYVAYLNALSFIEDQDKFLEVE